MANATSVAQAGLQGWREKVADAVAEPVSERTPLDTDQVRAAVGILFVALSVSYLIKTLQAVRRQA